MLGSGLGWKEASPLTVHFQGKPAEDNSSGLMNDQLTTAVSVLDSVEMHIHAHAELGMALLSGVISLYFSPVKKGFSQPPGCWTVRFTALCCHMHQVLGKYPSEDDRRNRLVILEGLLLCGNEKSLLLFPLASHSAGSHPLQRCVCMCVVYICLPANPL